MMFATGHDHFKLFLTMSPFLQIQGWGDHTSAGFTQVWLPDAGHDFVNEPHKQLVEAVAQVFS